MRRKLLAIVAVPLLARRRIGHALAAVGTAVSVAIMSLWVYSVGHRAGLSVIDCSRPTPVLSRLRQVSLAAEAGTLRFSWGTYQIDFTLQPFVAQPALADQFLERRAVRRTFDWECVPIKDARRRGWLRSPRTLGFEHTAVDTAQTALYPNAVYLRFYAIPLALPAAVSLVWPALWLARRRRDVRRGLAGLCLRCGYDLRASSGRCPECGAAAAPKPAA